MRPIGSSRGLPAISVRIPSPHEHMFAGPPERSAEDRYFATTIVLTVAVTPGTTSTTTM